MTVISHQPMYAMPQEVVSMIMNGGILVGSQAERLAQHLEPAGNRDWDVLVPPERWRRVGRYIAQLCAVARYGPTGYGGWRLTFECGLRIDAWPGTLRDHFAQCLRDRPRRNHYAWDRSIGFMKVIREAAP